MTKPTKKQVVEKMIDYHEMIRFIEEKYDIETRDYAKKKNPTGEYQDYWHWLIDHEFFEPGNPSSQTISVTEILNNKHNPDWVIEITQLIHDEFKDELDEDGVMEVWIEF